ncbi:MAG: hypothetical protein HYV67_04125 [Candidatus Taylorbacteria bacterium]|nr:hypothetical protein [Candidatus Taylorbacteria bacterium]
MKTVILLVMSFTVMAKVFGGEVSESVINALIQVESAGNDLALGDTNLIHKAYGCLQIRQPCVDDVNRRLGTNYRAEDCLGNRTLSILICRAYIGMYATEKRLGHEPTSEDMARIWNGGPNGFRKAGTQKYWVRVKKFLR